jgi:hypothetical protein
MTLRRMKTYTGAQGYVYQYYFVGQRQALADDPAAPAAEYIFDVTSDRKTTFAVSVLFPSAVRNPWESHHQRNLSAAEQYGAVKLRLFEAFDEIEDLLAHGRRLLLDSAALERALSTLGAG